jgi:uncharacterized membrane protein
MIRRIVVGIALAVCVLTPALPAGAQEDGAGDTAVRGVLFFSPTCPHCHQVISEDLPAIFGEFGGEPTLYFDETRAPEEVAFYRWTNGTIDLLVVDVSVEAGAALYASDTTRLAVPEDRRGVPRLTVGDEYLVGSREIPEEFPGIVAGGLSGTGIDWPAIEGIEDALADVPMDEPTSTTTTAGDTTTTSGETTAGGGDVTATTSAEGTATTGGNPDATVPSEGVIPVGEESIGDRIARDPLGNGIAIAVLVGMVVSLIAVHLMVRRGTLGSGPAWAIPVLGIVGMGVSIYLATVEAGGGEAVCGPVGDCNAVQGSEYAELFGIPIGVIGVAGYAVLLAAWIVSRLRSAAIADWAKVTILAVSLGGTLFSIYLTFLEPFVIGATCAWCLTSAIAITALLWLSAGPGWAALGRLRAR